MFTKVTTLYTFINNKSINFNTLKNEIVFTIKQEKENRFRFSCFLSLKREHCKIFNNFFLVVIHILK